jgi:hypothetical protein
MKDRISVEQLEKYFNLTSKALAMAKENIVPGKEAQAKEIINMVENYLSDARHFQENEDFVNAFAALNYTHGWLDSGVRLDVFEVGDNSLFTVK